MPFLDIYFPHGVSATSTAGIGVAGRIRVCVCVCSLLIEGSLTAPDVCTTHLYMLIEVERDS